MTTENGKTLTTIIIGTHIVDWRTMEVDIPPFPEHDSGFITTTKRVISVNGELKYKFIKCESYQPEHQLGAIVDVGIATGNVQLH